MIPVGKILRYLTNSGSISDDLSVHNWLESNQDNLRELDIYENIWNNTDQLKDFKVFDVDSEWQSFVAINDISADTNVSNDTLSQPVPAPKKEAKVIQLDSKKVIAPEIEVEDEKSTVIETPQIAVTSKKRSYILPLSIAASLLLLVGSYFTIFSGQDMPTPEPQLVYQVITTTDTPQTVTLEDGTIISLKENSELKYPESFAGLEERNIELNGSGTFKVTRNPDIPLVVEAGNTEVKVLGTTFVIDMGTEEEIEVENIEGIIKFYEAGNEENGHLLTEGQKMVHSGEGFTDITEEEIEEVKPLKGHTISHILNHLNLVSDGKMYPSPKLKYDKYKRFEINLYQDIESILMELSLEAEINYIQKDCDICREITEFKAVK